MKLSAVGEFLWARGLDGGINATGITIDAAGNVYAVGSYSATLDIVPGPADDVPFRGYADGYVVKFDSAGSFVWSRGFGGTDLDDPRDVAVAADGSVYVYGGFRGTADFDPGPGLVNLTATHLHDDFVLKLDRDGRYVWAKRLGGLDTYLGPDPDIGLDPDGNVVVAGQFTGTADFDPGSGVANLTSFGGLDAYAAKLDPAGNLLWVRQAGGTGNDRAEGLGVDPSGAVYVAGLFAGTADFDPGPGTRLLTSINTENSFLWKLDAGGNLAWAVLSVSGSNAVAIDSSRNVYTTGFVVKYRQGVDAPPVTVRVEDGRGGVDTQTFTIDVLSNRPPVITSTPVTTAFPGVPYRYDVDAVDPDADTLTYALTQAPTGMTIDPTTGVVAWVPDQSSAPPTIPFKLGSTGNDAELGIAIDPAGNTYLCGYFSGTVDFDPGPGTVNLSSLGGEDMYVAKYDVSGNLVWARSAGGTEPLDRAFGVTVDDQGNVYVTGDFRSPVVDFDPGPGVAQRTVQGLVDAFVWKLDGDGAFVWVRTLSGPGQDSIEYSPVSLDREGNAYVAGEFSNTADFDPGPGTYLLTSAGGVDAFVWKLDGQGNFVWARRAGGTADDVGTELALDLQGNVLVSGYLNNTADQPVDFDPGPGVFNLTGHNFVWKLDAAGDFLWARGLGANGFGGVLCTDAAGDVYIQGAFTGTVDFDPGPGTFTLTSAGGSDIFLWKLDRAGTFVWAKRFGGSNADGSGGGPGMVVDAEGNLYASTAFQQDATFSPGPGSFSLTSRGSYDVVLLKLASNGDVIWANQIGGPAREASGHLAIDDHGSVHSAGTFGGTVDFDPGPATYTLTSAGGDDIYHVAFTPDGDFLLRRGRVTVRVEDGRGGVDTQTFTINAFAGSPAEIRGTVFDDLSGDGARNTAQTLLVSAADTPVPDGEPVGIWRFNAADGRPLGSFLNGGDLRRGWEYTVGPDGDLYVIDWSTARILRYDGTTGQFETVLVTDSRLLYAGRIIIGADGNLLVTNSNHVLPVMRFNRVTGQNMGDFVPLGRGGLLTAGALTLGPDGRLYVSNARGGEQILRYDAVTGAFIDVFATFPPDRSAAMSHYGPYMIRFGPDGHLYVSDQGDGGRLDAGGRVIRFDGRTGTYLGEFISASDPGLNAPADLAWGGDGRLYVSDYYGHSVRRYDATTGVFINAFAPVYSAFQMEFAATLEPVLPGWTVYLDDNRNARRDPGERFTMTDASGNYAFTGLSAGAYTVAMELPSGWVLTAPPGGTRAVMLTAGQVVTGRDFGARVSTDPPPPPGPNRSPAFTSTLPTTATVGQLLRYNATASDPDGDPLAFDLVVKPVGMTIQTTTGIVIWVPTADQVGEHDVTLRVADGRGGVALQSFRVAVGRANVVPVITSVPTGPAVVGVAYRYEVRAQDADGDPITFSLSGPAGMTVDPNTGVVTWPPAAGQVGSPHVEVTASDGRGGATTQAFDLPTVATAPNQPPTVTSTPRGTIRVGDPYRYPVVASDPNNDPLAFSLELAPTGMTVDAAGLVAWTPTAAQLGANPVRVRVDDGRGGFVTQAYSVTVTTQATNRPPAITSTPPAAATAGRPFAYDLAAADPDGDPLVWTLDEAPVGVSVDPARGTLRWTPTADQLGDRRLVVRVIDGLGGWATQAFTVRVRAVNLPPNVTSAPPTTAAVGQAYSYPVVAADPDGDRLTFRLVAAPAGMTVDSATGLIRWTPTATQMGTQTVTLEADDGLGGVGRQAYSVVVSATGNRHPVVTSTPPPTATVGQPYRYPVTAADPDGDPLLFTLLVGPTGMAVDPNTGVLTWTPTAAQVGPRLITVAAVDPSGAGGTQTYTVVVTTANALPTITSNPVHVVTAGLPYRYDVRATDPDGDPLAYTLDQAPAGMTIDAAGRIRWAPGIPDIGTHSVVVSADDPHGGFVTQTFDLAVVADTLAPRLTLLVSRNPAPVNTPITFAIEATDNVGVAALTLTVGGQPVTLDAQGRATVTFPAPGVVPVVAAARDAAGLISTASTFLPVFDPSDTDAPVVDITAPTDGAVVTAAVDVVGTAADANLVSYVLEAAPTDTGVFVEFARGTASVTNGVLGRFDPSGLANGSYTLRLRATDAGGTESSVEMGVEVAGDRKVGNFTLSFTDLTVPVSGIPISVTRTYDTLTAGAADELGHGWRLEFRDTDLRTSVARTGMEEYGVYNPFRDGTRVYLTLPGGRREGFTFRPTLAPGFAGTFLGIYRPTFVPDRGVTNRLSVPAADLRRYADGTFEDYYGVLPYNPTDPAFGGTLTLTTKDGVAFAVDGPTGDLRTVTDLNGNALTFTDAGITSTSGGGAVRFERDGRGRIVAAVDPAGNRVRYRYDAAGDLVAVTDRDGAETRFEYAQPGRPHFLTKVIDPLGRTGVRTEYDDRGRLVRLIDATGQAVQLEHDPANSVEVVRDPLGNPTTFVYDERGNVVREFDPLGNETRRTYDLDNNTLSEENPLGQITRFTYDGAGNLTTETDPLGNVTRFTYGPLGQVLTTTDPLGNTTTNAYDGRGNLLSTTDAAGKTTRFEYDARGSQTSITDALGKTTRFEYDARGNLTRQTDPLGNDTEYTYDGNGNQVTQTTTLTTPTGVRTLTTRTRYDADGRPIEVTDAEGNVTRTEYDALGRQAATVDARNRRTEFRYDDRGQLTEVIFPDDTPATLADNPRTRTEYDLAGRAVARTDEAGRTTRSVYDAAGRLTETIFPDGTPDTLTDNPRTRTEYDEARRVTAQTDERGNRTTFGYDAAGRQVLVRDALGNETRTAYDAAGRTVSTTDALGRVTAFTLDSLGRQTAATFADGSVKRTGYDDLGRVVSRTDQLTRTTRFEYDALGRLVAVLDALNQRTEYGYDEAGNLIRQEDANDHATRYEYDGLGRRVATVLPLGQRSGTEYDAVGNVTRTTDFNGAVITFEYDPRNRLTAKHLPGGATTAFTYTPTGQRATVTDARGQTRSAYDERGRLKFRTDPDGTVISYEYDDAGNRTEVTTPAGTTAYTFDALNRTERVTAPDGGVTRYAYTAVGTLSRTDLPNGTVETRTYDALNRLTFLENRGPGGVISSSTYTPAATGRRDAVLEADGRRVAYTYDALDRLTGEAITDAAAGNRTLGYTYDAVGNRQTRTDTAEGTTTYTYDANDRLLTETAGTAVTTYTYDDNGNTKRKDAGPADRTEYTWDAENRLVRADVTDAAGTKRIDSRYDADGIRVAQAADGQETRYLIDTVQPYAQVLLEYRPSGLVVVSYVYGHDLISQTRGGAKAFYHVDGLGSTRALSDAAGAVTDRYAYEAFGRTIGQTGATPNGYLFAGEQRDAGLGLDYLRARYLSVGTGRFYGRDPFEGLLYDPSTWHRYIYTHQNSVNRIDPSGRQSWSLAEISVAVGIIGFLTEYTLSRSIGRATTVGLVAGFGTATLGVATAAGVSALVRSAVTVGLSQLSRSPNIWSGGGVGGVAARAAMSHASMNPGRGTLESTRAGYLLDLAYKVARNIPGQEGEVAEAQVLGAVEFLSRQLVLNARGDVHVFLHNPRWLSIFNTIEFPEILLNPRITSVIVHDLAHGTPPTGIILTYTRDFLASLLS